MKYLIELLTLQLAALEASKPTHDQYPEPRERHAEAIRETREALNHLTLKAEKYNGHIVHLKDRDSGDEFNVEVLILAKLPDVQMVIAAEKAALKSELATISGNTFETEYLQPSGRVTESLRIVSRRELIPTNPEGLALLESHKIE